jgi:dTDP-4-amino-4,6-dideoxygalactose transaminase
MEMKIPFSKVICNGNELKYINEVLESGWLTSSKKVAEFETEFAKIVGAQYAFAVNSCTSALHLALHALGVKPGVRVFVPTMTFTATAEVIRYCDADPVFLDVEYGTNLLTPEIIKDAIACNPDVKHLLVVHYGGQPAIMIRHGKDGILEICKKNGIKVIEDAAHAFPASIGGKQIGSLGDATCFSFYANKTITTGEGGMITTNSQAVAADIRIMRLHGIDRDVWNRYRDTKPNWEYDVVAPGYKYNMPDVNAAIGLAQLERYSKLHSARLRAARYYFKKLADLDNIDLPIVYGALEDHAWHLFHIVLKPECKMARNDLILKLAEFGIGTSVHYKPLHRMTYYQMKYDLNFQNYPNAERMWQGCVSLPLFPSLTEHEQDYICTKIKQLEG